MSKRGEPRLCRTCGVSEEESPFTKHDRMCKPCEKAYHAERYKNRKGGEDTKDRVCGTCGVSNSDAEFIPYQNLCKPCATAYRAEYRARRREAPIDKVRICRECGVSSEDTAFVPLNNLCTDCRDRNMKEYRQGYVVEMESRVRTCNICGVSSESAEFVKGQNWCKKCKLEWSYQPVQGDSALKYAAALTIDDAPEVNEGVLTVKCSYCGERFTPTRVAVGARVSALYGKQRGEHRLYCSEECKGACPVFRKQPGHSTSPFYNPFEPSRSQRADQAQLREMVLERDGHACVRCGATENLVCHHTDPVANNPIESLDMDKCITVCEDCHKELHKIPGCGLHELRCDVKVA